MRHPIASLLLMLINIIYFLSGVTVLVFGIIGLVDYSVLVDLFRNIEEVKLVSGVLDFNGIASPVAIYFTCLGGVAMALSLLGCAAGFVRKHKFLLFLYGFFKIALILFELAVIIYNSVQPLWMENNVRKMMLNDLSKTDDSYTETLFGNTTIQEQYGWSNMQYEQACCGVDSYLDYSEINSNWWYNSTLDANVTAVVPFSCCMQHVNYRNATSIDSFVDLPVCLAAEKSPPEDVNYRGCLDYVLGVIGRYNYSFIIVASWFIALEVISFSLSLIVIEHGKQTGSIN